MTSLSLRRQRLATWILLLGVALALVSSFVMLYRWSQWTPQAGGDRGGAPSRAGGVHGGRWSEAIPHGLWTFDPAHAVTVTEQRVLALIFEGLVRLTPDGRIIPGLASRWSVSPDGLVYEFTLRPGLRFHDGRPVTSRDVVFSFRRLLDPNTASPRSWVMEGLMGADAFRAGVTRELPGLEAPDERTVRLTLARPFPPFLALLTLPAAASDPADAPPTGSDWEPVGAGPFQLVERAADGSLRLAAFAAYHGGRPYLNEVTLTVMPDAEERLQAFLSRKLSVVHLTAALAEHLTRELGWTGPLERVDVPAVYYLALNNQRPPLTDPLVRRAIYQALDRRAILDEVLHPDGYVLANGSIPPGFAGHDPEAAAFPYDPQQARQLLVQTGHAQGFDLELVQSPAPLIQMINQRIKEQLADVGIRVTIRTLSHADFWAATGRNGQAHAFVVSWWADYPDSNNFLSPLFHSERWGAGGNRARFSSPEIDALLEQLQGVRDERQRARLYRQVERQIFARVPWIPLFFPTRYTAVSPDVRGYRAPVFDHGQTLWDVWIEPRR